MTSSGVELRLLAAEMGVEIGYWDVSGRRREASDRSLLSVIRASGIPIDTADEAPFHRRRLARRRCEQGLEPVVVVWDGEAVEVLLWLPDRLVGPSVEVGVSIALDSGGERQWELDLSTLPRLTHAVVESPEASAGEQEFRSFAVGLPPGLPVGRHGLDVRVSDERFSAVVLSAPRSSPSLEPWERTWGVLAPLYSLWRSSGVGPDVSLLDDCASWVAGHGAQIVATLPLLSTFADEPFDPSPYAPVSRCFWNELYIDLGRLPGQEASATAATLASVPADVGDGSVFDYRSRARLTRGVLGAAADAFFQSDDRADLDAFVESTPEVLDYAEFRAAVDRFGSGWQSWPEPCRSGDLSGASLSADAVNDHLYMQWVVQSQLAALSRNLADRGQRLYLDLPVGSHPSGYDVWRNQDLFALSVSTGAPPDDFFEGGQSWGFPPLRPSASRRDGHRFFASCLRAHLRYSRMLRIDHVMQLERLFWVPEDSSPEDGVYVRYPREELFAVLMIESSRSDCVLVGEDLGTVPDEIRHAMNDHGVLGMYVLQFETPADGGDPRPPPHRSVSSVNTHDTPTFASFARALDIERRLTSGLLGPDEAGELRGERRRRLDGLRSFLDRQGLADPGADESAVLRAALHWLARSDSACLLVTLDDLWSEVEPHNVPGTPIDRPNWVLRWPRSLADLASDTSLGAELDAIQRHRLGAFARAAESR
jgi:4-alpha-glucanotransferase